MQGHGEPDHVAGAVVDPWGVCPGCGGRVCSTLPIEVSVVEPQNHPMIVHWLHLVWASKLGGMVLERIIGVMGRHRGGCVKVKQLHGVCVVARSKFLELVHFLILSG